MEGRTARVPLEVARGVSAEGREFGDVRGTRRGQNHRSDDGVGGSEGYLVQCMVWDVDWDKLKVDPLSQLDAIWDGHGVPSTVRTVLVQ